MLNVLRRLFMSQQRGNIALTMVLQSLIIILVCTVISWAVVKDDPNNPREPVDFEDDEMAGQNSSAVLRRPKRQWGCPNGCFSPCMHDRKWDS